MKVNFKHPNGKIVKVEEPTELAYEVYLKHGFEVIDEEKPKVEPKKTTKINPLKRLLIKKGK